MCVVTAVLANGRIVAIRKQPRQQPAILLAVLLMGFRLPEGIEYLVGHNVDYDWKVIGQPEIKRICMLALCRSFFPALDSHSICDALSLHPSAGAGVA